ncbi:response regulator [Eubacteriaceae bacterium ES2]|nr:response regulator [Eubacteriaceae bacterium ES2]
MKTLSECNVLIVDDTEINIDILVEALGDDYDLSVALDGETALEIISEEMPDLILLDIMMPGMSGYEVCHLLKNNHQTKDIPIIFLTAMTDIDSKKKAFEAGAVDYITKPFEIIEVRARTQTHLMLTLIQQDLDMKNKNLEKLVEIRTKELCMTQDITIEALAALAEYRDPDTGGHINRTKNYVRILGRALHNTQKYHGLLTEKLIEELYKSAPLHDIGKIGIRDEILLKPGKLTEEEFTIMKNHTLIGFNAIQVASNRLGGNSFLKSAMEFSKYHHERWDGMGYPDKLSGEDIPLPGRIMAVADVYDALISKRCYKQPFAHREAVGLINEGKGSQFDPDIVDVFMKEQEAFRQIALKYADCEEERIKLNEI